MTTGASTTETAIRVLGPDARPRAQFPRWIAFVLGTAFLFNLASKGANVFAPIAAITSMLAGIAAATWLEDGIYHALRSKRVALHALIALTLPLAGPLGGAILSALTAVLPNFLDVENWLVPALMIGGLWFGGAAIGSLVIFAIDVAVSAVIESFRARIIIAVLSVLAIVSFFWGSLGLIVIVGLDALRAGSTPGNLSIDLGDGPVPINQLIDLVAYTNEHPVIVALAMFAAAIVIGLPAVLSVSAKLADAVMERIYPLAAAFDAVRSGDRRVHLEEAGSSDFRRVSSSFNRMVDALGLAERMERAFGKYVSAHVLGRIRNQHGDAAIPAESREATVFFADIRGFTTMSEKLSPEAVVSILNRYFERVVQIIDAHEGYLNKFIGDAVVVVFNGPLDQPDHAVRATRCAIALQETVTAMNAAGAFPEIGALQVGVGVSTGAMVCGNVGSDRQMEYTVIGDSVNLASRFTGVAGAGEVLVSERTAALLPEEIPRAALEPIKVKGKHIAVTPFRVWPKR